MLSFLGNSSAIFFLKMKVPTTWFYSANCALLLAYVAFITALKFSGLYDRSFLAMLESVDIKRIAFFST